MTVSLTGFATLVREGIQLAVGQTIALSLVLKVSSVQEEVVVTGAAPLVETSARLPCAHKASYAFRKTRLGNSSSR